MSKKLKVIIFDFDGTIADSIEAFIGIARQLSGDNTRIEARELRSLRGLIRFAQRASTPVWRFPIILSKVRTMVDKNIHEITPFEGMPEAIKALHKQGYKLFIVSTNNRYTIEKFLKINGLSKYFSGVYGSRKLIKSKVRSLKTLLTRQKLKANSCVYIGDEPRDGEASRAVGMPWIAVSWGFTKNELLKKFDPLTLVELPKEIPSTVTKLNKNN